MNRDWARLDGTASKAVLSAVIGLLAERLDSTWDRMKRSSLVKRGTQIWH